MGAAPAFFFYGRFHGENHHFQRPAGSACAIHARRHGHPQTLRATARRPRSPSPRVAGPVAGQSRRLSVGKPRLSACPGSRVRPPPLRVTKTLLFSWAQAGGNSRTIRTGNSLIPGSSCLRFFDELSQKRASHNRSVRGGFWGVFCGRQTASGTETGPEPHPIERSSPVKRMRTSCWPSYPSHRAEPLERLVDLLPRADGQKDEIPVLARLEPRWPEPPARPLTKDAVPLRDVREG